MRLLDIWTSSPDFIELRGPRGRSADGFKAWVRLGNANTQRNTEWASVRYSMAEKKSIKSSNLTEKMGSLLQQNLQTINFNMEGEMIREAWSRCLSPFTRNHCSCTRFSLFSLFGRLGPSHIAVNEPHKITANVLSDYPSPRRLIHLM